ncbi:hypothetical protein JCM11641_001490 [Rhodosporidiobolus odoratus]
MAAPSPKNQVTTLQASINALLALIKQPSSVTSSSSSNPPSVDLIRSDLVALIALLSKEVTALCLALKPPASQDAVSQTLVKVNDLAGKVKFAFEELGGRQSVLAKRLVWTVTEALESLATFLGACVPLLPPCPPQTGAVAKKLRDTLLSSAKVFWGIAEQAGTLPQSELEAVRASWKGSLELMDDALGEVKDLSETLAAAALSHGGEEAEDEEEEDDVDDDDFTSKPLSEREQSRASTVYTLLRLSRLLLHRLLLITGPSSPCPSLAAALSTAAFLSAAHTLSQRLSSVFDDVCASLEGPQDPEEVEEGVEEVESVDEELGKALEAAIEHGEGVKEEERAKQRGWMEVWRKSRSGARDKFDAIEDDAEEAEE